MQEIFKPIKDYEDYQISNLGNIKSLKSGKEKILKLRINNFGYVQVCFHYLGKKETKNVHRLVAQTFLENPENKPQINHKNGIKDDNRIENLEWCTNQENQKHSFEKLGRKGSRYGKYGSDNCLSKKVVQFFENGEIKNFGSIIEASKITGINKNSISLVCNGHRKTAGGFVWKF